MKGTDYINAQIVTADELDFTEASKALAIEQTRYDFLEQKGVVENSGMTSGHTSDPLLAYFTNSLSTINVYSGIAYDSLEGKSRRIWVPDAPSDIPANVGEAQTNYDNIDSREEYRERGFEPGSRPARVSIKTFTGVDIIGAYHVCIRYYEGTYDPITVPSDGSIVNSKIFESYEFRVSQSTAIVLGEGWMQLATVAWDGAELSLTSDDRTFASALIAIEHEAILRHQDRMHENGIVRQYGGTTNYLKCTITNAGGNPRVIVAAADLIFASGDGVLVNGTFVTTMQNSFVNFDDGPASNDYYIYVDENGNLLRTTIFALADQQGCILCRVYYDQTSNQLMYSNTTPWTTAALEDARDMRRFGTVGEAGFQFIGLPVANRWSPISDLTLKEISDQFIEHRGGASGVLGEHGCSLITTNNTPYAATVGSLAISGVGSSVATALAFVSSDYAVLDGRRIGSLLTATVDLAGEASDTYYIYLNWVGITGGYGYREHGYIRYTSNVSVATGTADLLLAVVVYDGGAGQITSILDMRAYGTLSYADIQHRNNASGLEVLPQLVNSMWGSITIGGEGDSGTIYLTDNWGSGTAGGGTSGGNTVFSQRPNIMVYVDYTGTGYSTWHFGLYEFSVGGSIGGYYYKDVTPRSFEIHNDFNDPYSFYWIAIGPSAITGEHNPYYA